MEKRSGEICLLWKCDGEKCQDPKLNKRKNWKGFKIT
jgi:hypothetical protein